MGKHWRFCGTSWMNMKVIHEPDCYGKDNSRKFIRTWMGQGTNLGMYVCSSKTRVISVSFRGWHLNGWREAEYGSHVAEIDAKCWHWRTRIISWPCTFGMCSADANQMKHLLNSTRRCWITHFCWGNWKFTRAGKTSRKNCSVVLWHGRTGSKMRWVVLWTGKNWSSFTKIQVRPCLGVNTTPTCTRADANLSRAHLTVHDSCSPIRPLNTGYEPNFYSYLNEEPRRSISVTVSRAVTTPPSSQLPKIQKFLTREDPGAARKPQLAGCHHVGIVRCEPLEAAAWVGWQSCEHSGINVDRECVVSKRRAFVDRQKISRQSLIRKLTRPSEEREWLSRNCMKLMLKLRQEIDIAFHETNEESESQRFQLHGQISLNVTKSACMENWNWEIDSSKTIMQEIAKKLKNWEELIAKKQIEQDKQALMNCLCIKRGILRLWVNFLTQIQDLQNKVNSLTDAREFHNPESGISSGATHVPDQTSTILSPRTLPRCDSGMPRDTQCGTGITGNVFERPRAEEGLSSTICKNSKNLASSSQWLRPDTTGIARKRDDEMKREPLSVPSPHFESKSCMLDHTGGTSSHNGMMDYPRFPISELHLGKIPDSMKVQSWKVNQLQDWSLFEKHILLSQCSGSKKLRLQNQLMNFEHRDRLWSTISTISICLMRWLRLHWESFSTSRHFSKRECRRAACLETRPILTWETNCLHGIRAFPCNRSL